MALTPQNKKTILGIAVALGITGIGAYLYTQYKKLYNAGVKLAGAKVYNLGINNVKFTILLAIENKGDLSVKITDQKYQISIGEIYVSTITNDKNVLVRSKGTTYLPLTIEFNPKNALISVLQNITSLFNDKSKFVFNINGKLSIEAGIVKLKDYEIKLSFNLQEIIDLSNKPSQPEI